MFGELALGASHVVYRRAPQFIMRSPVAHDPVLLSEHLRLMVGMQTVTVALFTEELVVLVRRGPIVDTLLEADLEICHTHAQCVAHICLLLQFQFFWRVGRVCRCLLLKLCGSVRLCEREVRIARFLLERLVLALC